MVFDRRFCLSLKCSVLRERFRLRLFEDRRRELRRRRLRPRSARQRMGCAPPPSPALRSVPMRRHTATAPCLSSVRPRRGTSHLSSRSTRPSACSCRPSSRTCTVAVFTPSEMGNRGNLGKDLCVHTLDFGEFTNRIFVKNIRTIFVDRRAMGTAT